MAVVQQAAHLRIESVELAARLRRHEQDAPDKVREAPGDLRLIRLDRHQHDVIEILPYLRDAAMREHANDLEWHAADPDRLADGTRAPEQLPGDRLSEQDDLALRRIER